MSESRYAWIIDSDGNGEPNRTGTMGPGNAPADLLTALLNGAGDRFRMLNDDGEVDYTGRRIAREGAEDERVDFGPLWDFGTPDAGSTMIQYREGSRWVTV